MNETDEKDPTTTPEPEPTPDETTTEGDAPTADETTGEPEKTEQS